MPGPFDPTQGIPDGFSTEPDRLDYYRNAPAYGGMAIPNPPDPELPAEGEAPKIDPAVERIYALVDRQKQAAELYRQQDEAVGKRLEGLNVEDLDPEFADAEARGARLRKTIEDNPWISEAVEKIAVPPAQALAQGVKQVTRGHLATLD